MLPTEEFEQAQQLARQGKYKEAQQILLKHKNNEVAAKLLTRIKSAELQARVVRRTQNMKQVRRRSSLKWAMILIVGIIVLIVAGYFALTYLTAPSDPPNSIPATLTAMTALPADRAASMAGTQTSFESRLGQFRGVSTVWIANISYNEDSIPLVYAEIRVDRGTDMQTMATDLKDLSAAILITRQFQGFALLLDDGINYVIYDFDFTTNTWNVAPMEAFSATRAVNATATQRARPTSTPRPTRTPVRADISATCLCNRGNYLNCSNFSSANDAQVCHNKCIREVGSDVHNLDEDEDGVACEVLR